MLKYSKNLERILLNAKKDMLNLSKMANSPERIYQNQRNDEHSELAHSIHNIERLSRDLSEISYRLSQNVDCLERKTLKNSAVSIEFPENLSGQDHWPDPLSEKDNAIYLSPQKRKSLFEKLGLNP